MCRRNPSAEIVNHNSSLKGCVDEKERATPSLLLLFFVLVEDILELAKE